MKMGGGQQLARSRYLLRESSGSIHLDTDSWNFSQHPTFLRPSGRSAPSRSNGNGSSCSRRMSPIAASGCHAHLDMIHSVREHLRVHLDTEGSVARYGCRGFNDSAVWLKYFNIQVFCWVEQPKANVPLWLFGAQSPSPKEKYETLHKR